MLWECRGTRSTPVDLCRDLRDEGSSSLSLSLLSRSLSYFCGLLLVLQGSSMTSKVYVKVSQFKSVSDLFLKCLSCLRALRNHLHFNAWQNNHDTWKEEGYELVQKKRVTLQFWFVCLQPCAVCSDTVQNEKMLLAGENIWWVDPGWMRGTHQSRFITPLLSWTGERKYNERLISQD